MASLVSSAILNSKYFIAQSFEMYNGRSQRLEQRVKSVNVLNFWYSVDNPLMVVRDFRVDAGNALLSAVFGPERYNTNLKNKIKIRYENYCINKYKPFIST